MMTLYNAHLGDGIMFFKQWYYKEIFEKMQPPFPQLTFQKERCYNEENLINTHYDFPVL